MFSALISLLCASVVFVGDDTPYTFDKNWGAQYVWERNWQPAPYNAVNLGVNVQYAEALQQTIENGLLDSYSPDVIVVQTGHSNFKQRGDAVAKTVSAVSNVLESIKAKKPSAKIVLSAIVPQYGTADTSYLSKVAEANVELAKLADGATVRWCGYDHAFHKDEGGYLRWTGALTKTVNAALRNDVAPTPGSTTVVKPTYSKTVVADIVVEAMDFIAAQTNLGNRVVLPATSSAVVNQELAKLANGHETIYCGDSTQLAAIMTEAAATDQLPIGPVYADDDYEAVVIGEVAATRPVTRIYEASWRGLNWWGDRLKRNRATILASGGNLDFVVCGDSITHFWESGTSGGGRYYDSLTNCYTTLNCGYGGDTTETLLWRLQNGELDGYTAKVVMMLIGTNNNGINGYNPTNTAAGVKACLDVIKSKQPTAKIILMAYFPVATGSEGDVSKSAQNDRNLASMLKIREDIADEENVTLIDIYSKFLNNGVIPATLMGDYIHPTESGYGLWYDAIVPTLSSVIGKTPVAPSKPTGYYYWNAINGDASGAFDNPAHWTLSGKTDHFVPSDPTSDRAYLGDDVKADYTVTFPAGVYTNCARLIATVEPGHTVTLDLSNTEYVHPPIESGTYSTEPFEFTWEYWYGKSIFTLNTAGATPDRDTAGHLDVKNTVITMTAPAASVEKAMELEFKGGDLNLYNCFGHTWNAKYYYYPRLYLHNYGNNGSSIGEPKVCTRSQVVFKNANLAAPSLCLQGNAWDNLTDFIGGTHTAASLYMPARWDGQSFSENRTTNDLVVEAGASLTISNRTEIANSVRGTNRLARITAKSGGAFTLSELHHWYGDCWLLADGGTVQFGRGNQDFDYTTINSVRIQAINNGLVAFQENDPGASSNGAYIGNSANATVQVLAEATAGGTIEVMNGGKVNQYAGSIYIHDDGRLVNHGVMNLGNTLYPVKLLVNDGIVSNTTAITLGTGARGHAYAAFTNATLFSSLGNFYVGGSDSGAPSGIYTSKVEFVASEWVLTQGAQLCIGYQPHVNGEFVMRSGYICSPSESYTFEIGYYGNGTYVQYGGTSVVHRARIGASFISGVSDTEVESVFRLEGGLFKCFTHDNGQCFCAAQNASHPTRMILNGGELQVYAVYGATGGKAALEANGGSVRLNGRDSASFGLFSNFKTLELGPKGLTLLPDGYTIKLVQGFSDKSGEQGQLILAGSGATTIESTCDFSNLSRIVVSNTTLNVYAANTIAVGALTWLDSSIVVKDTTAIGNVYTLFSLDEEPSAATKAALAQAKVSGGVPADAVTEISVVESAGKYLVQLTVREAIVVAVAGDNTVEVDDAADLGEVLQLQKGVLHVTGPAAGIDYAGKVALAQSGAADHVIVNNAVDLTLPLPTATSSDGGFTKRGAGTLTFEVEGSKTAFNGWATDDYSKGYWSERMTLTYPMLFDAVSGLMTNGIVATATGAVTNGTYGALSLVEGETRFVGKGDNAQLTMTGEFKLARPCPDGTVSPGCVIDNLTLSNTLWNANTFIASGLKFATPITADFATEPYLILTNHACFAVKSLAVNRLNGNTKQRTRIEAYDSTLNVYYYLYANRAQYSECQASYKFVNSSLIVRNAILMWRDFTMDFDNSMLMKSGAKEPVTLMVETSTALSSGTCTMNFRNGSVAYLGTIQPTTAKTVAHPMIFNFDDSEWCPVTSGDYTTPWTGTDRERIVINANGGGLKLAVPAAATWTITQPITGTGAVVLDGAGTLTMAEDAIQCAGGVVLKQGTLKDTTLAKVTLAVDYQGEPLSNTATLDGVTAAKCVVDLGHDRTDPLDLDSLTDLEVGAYTGDSCAVANWKLAGTGVSGAKGVFEAKDGKIVLKSAAVNGIMMLIR